MSDPILPSDPEEVWIVVKPSGVIVHECQPYRTEARALERRRASANERVIGPYRHAPEPEQRRPTATARRWERDYFKARDLADRLGETVELLEPDSDKVRALVHPLPEHERCRERALPYRPHEMSRGITVGDLREKLAKYEDGTVVVVQGPDDTEWPMAAWVGTDEREERVYLPAMRSVPCASGANPRQSDTSAEGSGISGEDAVVAYVEELTGGLSAPAEAKLRALLRRK